MQTLPQSRIHALSHALHHIAPHLHHTALHCTTPHHTVPHLHHTAPHCTTLHRTEHTAENHLPCMLNAQLITRLYAKLTFENHQPYMLRTTYPICKVYNWESGCTLNTQIRTIYTIYKRDLIILNTHLRTIIWEPTTLNAKHLVENLILSYTHHWDPSTLYTKGT